MLLFEFRSHDRFVSHKNDREIEIRNNACLGFDLMIEVSTSWSILLDKFDLMNKHNFDLMINDNFDLMKFDLKIIAQNGN
jgi:hypothetical protein